MPRFGAISRRDLIDYLRQYSFEGPYSGGKHQFLIKGTLRLTIPNPHQSDIGIDLLSKILKQAGISREGWNKL
jgi:predicted RNA binding protein YcfA (HicA-like mRNA interferase family)